MVRIAALQDAEQLEILNNETECTSRSLDIFYNMSISNECAAKRMLSIAEKQFGDVLYIANLDSLGFPTVRIFIKGVSTAYYWQGENPLRLIEINNRIRHHIKENMINSLSMLNLMQEGRKFLSNKFTYKLRNITGVICNDKIGEVLLNNYWFFCGLLALHNNCIKVARKSAMKIKEDGEFSQDEINVIQTTFNAIIEGKDECECQNIIGHIFKNEKRIILR